MEEKVETTHPKKKIQGLYCKPQFLLQLYSHDKTINDKEKVLSSYENDKLLVILCHVE